MLKTVTIPVLRVKRDPHSDEFFVQQRTPLGRWKRVSEDYGHITSAKAKLGNVVLELIAEAEEAEK